MLQIYSLIHIEKYMKISYIFGSTGEQARFSPTHWQLDESSFLHMTKPKGIGPGKRYQED
jgi:hypothetical protein